jgi:prolyl 4-hydroxylase
MTNQRYVVRVASPLDPLPGSDPEQLAAACRAVRGKLDATPGVQRVAIEPMDMYLVRDFASPEECAGLIALTDRDAQPSKRFSATSDPSFRTSHTCYLDPADPLVATIDRRMADLLGIAQPFGEAIQAQRYEPGQQFKVHNDYFASGMPFSDAVAEEGGQRTWTAMLFLDAPDAGGHTHFPYVGVKIPPRPRALMIWNNLDAAGLANAYTRHAGLPVEAGVKHVITKWFRERPWSKSDRTDAYRS